MVVWRFIRTEIEHHQTHSFQARSFPFFSTFFFNLQARATSDRSRQFRRHYKNYTSGWLYKWMSLEKFLRLT